MTRKIFHLFIPPALMCLALLSKALAVSPAPDGGYAGNNTAEGTSALFNLTSGIDNTALGFEALKADKNGSFNTATGVRALFSNIAGLYNTADGAFALAFNTGSYNTASGYQALYSNTSGANNTAVGQQALYTNTTGTNNTAVGQQALFSNATVSGFAGHDNTAFGFNALQKNTNGVYNTAAGSNALVKNTTPGSYNSAFGYLALYNNIGYFNTAIGSQALWQKTTGDGNIALGYDAGSNLATGSSYNIDIGNLGIGGDDHITRIGSSQNAIYLAGIAGQSVGAGGTTCYVDNDGKLGVFLSARRFKTDIADMNSTSEAVLRLRPVTFRYKPEIKATDAPQFGLIAEEVAEINPDLVTRDGKGELSTVRYEAVNAMLLNEFLKEHKRVQELQSTVENQSTTITQQREGMELLAATLKQQAAQLKKQEAQLQTVSAQLATIKPATQLVSNQ